MIAPGARTKENELSSSVLGCQGGQGLIEAGQSLIQGEIPPRKYGRTAQVSGSSNLRGRSAGTRTLGLLLPKQARYQLRNTPAFLNLTKTSRLQQPGSQPTPLHTLLSAFLFYSVSSQSQDKSPKITRTI